VLAWNHQFKRAVTFNCGCGFKSMFGYVGASTFPTVLLKQAVWLTATHVFKFHGPTQITFQTQNKQKQLFVAFVVTAVQKTLQPLPKN